MARTAWSAGPLLVAGAVLLAALGAVSPGGAVTTARAPAPNDELFPQQWNLEAIGIPRAWDVSMGEGVVVAVLDTGVAYEDDGPYRKAPDLAGTRLVPGWDFVDDDTHPNDVPVPGEGSPGTHVAGIIAQTTNNALGTAGVAPEAAIMPIRVLGPDASGAGQAIARGLHFAADNGAAVANVSLGRNVDTALLAEGVSYAVGKGVTVVVSPGEGGLGSLAVAAAVPDALAVGAVGYENARTEYSYYGPGLDLVAPGGDTQVDQNRDGIDDGIVAQTLFERPDGFCFCFRQGMSSAAAHVSGVAALVVAAGRGRTPAEVRDVLVSTAADLGPPGPDEEYGAGLVQATRALGMPPLSGEVAPRTGEGRPDVRPAPAPEADDGDVPVAPESGVGQNPRAEALFGPSPRRPGGSGVGEWLRRRRAELAGLGALVLVSGTVSLVRRRRDRVGSRPPAPAETLEP